MKLGVSWFPLKVASKFLDLEGSVHIVTITTGANYTVFLDLECLVYGVTITTGVTYSFIILSKSGLHIAIPSMFCICNNQYNWGKLYFLWFPLKMASTTLDLVCSLYVVIITIGINYHIFLDLIGSVYVVTITIWVSYSFIISSKTF